MIHHPLDCIYCCLNVKKRSNFKGHRAYVRPRAVRLEGVTEMLRRHQKATPLAGGDLSALMAKEVAACPTLTEFIALGVWPDDGKERITGTVLLFADGGMNKVMLNDRDQGLVAFLTVGPGESLFKAIEKALASEGTDWRASKKTAPRKG